MKTFLAIPLTLLFTFLTATATEQENDLIILEGERIYADQSPGLKEAFPSLELPEFSVISTANYKGYRPTWATFDGQLYLVGLEAKIKGESGLLGNSKVLKGVKFPVPVKEWSGIFKVVKNLSFFDPNTEATGNITMTTTIHIEKGKVTKVDRDKKDSRDKK